MLTGIKKIERKENIFSKFVTIIYAYMERHYKIY